LTADSVGPVALSVRVVIRSGRRGDRRIERASSAAGRLLQRVRDRVDLVAQALQTALQSGVRGLRAGRVGAAHPQDLRDHALQRPRKTREFGLEPIRAAQQKGPLAPLFHDGRDRSRQALAHDRIGLGLDARLQRLCLAFEPFQFLGRCLGAQRALAAKEIVAGTAQCADRVGRASEELAHVLRRLRQLPFEAIARGVDAPVPRVRLRRAGRRRFLRTPVDRGRRCRGCARHDSARPDVRSRCNSRAFAHHGSPAESRALAYHGAAIHDRSGLQHRARTDLRPVVDDDAPPDPRVRLDDGAPLHDGAHAHHRARADDGTRAHDRAGLQSCSGIDKCTVFDLRARADARSAVRAHTREERERESDEEHEPCDASRDAESFRDRREPQQSERSRHCRRDDRHGEHRDGASGRGSSVSVPADFRNLSERVGRPAGEAALLCVSVPAAPVSA